MVPFAPATNTDSSGYIVYPTWKQEKRADFLNPKKIKSQDKISMKWKYKNGG